MPNILIVSGGSNLHVMLRDLGPDIRTSVICRASALPLVGGLADNRAVIVLADDTPTEGWLAAARRLHQEWPVDRVAAFSEIDQDRAAAVAERLRVPCHRLRTVRLTQDKLRMRRRLRAAGVEDVLHLQSADLAELTAFQEAVGGPVVLKPTSGRASVGVAVAATPGELPAALTATTGARVPRLDPSPPLAEAFVPGPEYSVEAVTAEGAHHVLAVTEKFKDAATKVETGHVMPARLDPDTERAVVAHVRTVLDALGVESGPTHTEVIVGPRGPVTVETHLRIGGDEILHLVRDVSGVDIYDLWARQAAGLSVADDPGLSVRRGAPVYAGAAAIRYLAPDLRGRLVRIEGLAEAAALEGVRDVRQLLPDGTELTGLHSSYARLAHVRVTAADAGAAVALADKAVGLLRPVTD
ncbi:ATP-grasp domain-containing protein [Streptomyces beihaiensis]|uniref:ATP-grasp domain-containing protein n=1 Tax=Streptomyces beihaiensis TaxID=2984495 RepID=A0ABT3TXS1_9ACTN|nr:ATP-grasp domain-containing protein [Streptomyces beihaiensis]MCX3061836.1 ATP-grasp domain-containing protein [Streptomyces beihaiensis]